MPSDEPDVTWEIRTPRLTIRRARPCEIDIALLLELWTDPAVMANVGFPNGLNTNAEKIETAVREMLREGTKKAA